MKHSKLFKLAATCILLFVLAALPFAMSGFGQNPSDPNQSIGDTTRHHNDRGTNWGWLGLLGLAGLVGLTRKSHTEPAGQRAPGVGRT